MVDSQSTPQGATDTDPSPSPLVAAAIGLHESFVAYTAAGFTEDQALRLIALVVTGGRRG